MVSPLILAIILQGIPHGPKVGCRNIILNVMNGRKYKTTPGSHDIQDFFYLVFHLLLK